MDPERLLPFGTTRSRVTNRYALITADTHVKSPLMGWQNASAVVHIAPEIGARFTQYTATLEASASSAMPGGGVERFIFVLEGTLSLTAESKTTELRIGQYAFLPAGVIHQISTAAKPAKPNEPVARLAVFEKLYQATDLAPQPSIYLGDQQDRPGDIFLGDPALRLQTLLPIEPSFDMAVNIFTYDSGGHLPQVEIHVMEHGLLMLDGTGVYRLDNDWFPVQAGDVIWMASYCPQWFVAMGKQPARYLYYKDIHRDRLTEKQ